MEKKDTHMKSSSNYKAPLTKELISTFKALQKGLSTKAKSQRSIKIIPFNKTTISITDLIAYQIGWGTLVIYWYAAGINNISPQMPGDGFDTWNYSKIACHFYKKYTFDGWQLQDQELQNVVNKIISIIEQEHSSGNLDKANVWDWCTLKSGKAWPLSKWIRVNTIAPYKRATRLIKEHT